MPPEQWEIWIDTQLSPAIAKWMAEYTGYIVKSSYSLQLHNLSDLAIYNSAAKQGNIILISKDADFPELINRLGSPPKLIMIKKGNCNNAEMWEFIKPNIIKSIELLMFSDVAIIEFE